MNTQDEDSIAGLCARCRHVARIVTPRASFFYMCQLSFTDRRFAKYPALPVIACQGFEPAAPPPAKDQP